MSRLVWNHSSHVLGSTKAMKKLLRHPEVSVVVPGPLATTKRSAPLKYRVTVPVLGGHKVLVRRGRAVQEYFITTTLTADELQEAIDGVTR